MKVYAYLGLCICYLVCQFLSYRNNAHRAWSSIRFSPDLSKANHLYHGILHMSPYLTTHPAHLGYTIHPLLLSIKVHCKRCFPPQFEMMQNWSLFHQAGCSCLWTNQRPPQENSNCGEKQILHLINKSHKIWVWWCNLGFQSIFWECTSIIHYCMTIGSP